MKCLDRLAFRNDKSRARNNQEQDPQEQNIKCFRILRPVAGNHSHKRGLSCDYEGTKGSQSYEFLRMRTQCQLCRVNTSLRIDPLFKRRKGLRNNEQKLATASSRFRELNLCSLC